MCWKGDHPDSTIEEWLDGIRQTVDKHGWAVQYVEDDHAPFAYTVGLHEHGLPELLITGLPPQPTVRLLNGVATYLMDGGGPLLPGELISAPGGQPPLMVVQVDHPDAHMNVAAAFYGPELRAVQLVWADGAGHRPWCDQFSNGAVWQPVFGLMPEPAP